MITISNSDIARKYKVSPASVTGWIENAINGKNNLKLTKVKNRFQVLDSLDNHAELTLLAESGKKFRAGNPLSKVSPSEEFYRIFNKSEVAEIANTLEIKHEIIDKYVYKDQGAVLWDQYYKEHTNNSLFRLAILTQKLIDLAVDYCIYSAEGKLKYNLIDLGPGNSYPTKPVIEKLQSNNLMNVCGGVDISPEILDISEQNLAEWFPTLQLRRLVCDLENCDLNELLMTDRSDDVANLIVHIGNTYCNHENRVKFLMNVSKAMSRSDLLLLTVSMDTLDTRMETRHMDTDDSNEHDKIIPKMLGIDADACDFRVQFDSVRNIRAKYMSLDKDYQINFKNYTVKLSKGDDILMWRHYLATDESMRNELKLGGLKSVYKAIDPTGSYAVYVCKVI
ncbi:MAG: hypothetical protein OHK0017_08070 [Patescibacteria group bacterium]